MSQSITNLSLVAAFSAGLLLFVSPCVLPLVPSYISYITGLSIEQLTDSTVRSKFKKAITGADFLRFQNVLAQQYRRRDLHVLLDNSSTHKTPNVRAWLEAHPRVHFHFTPTGASWLNMVEAWFSILTRKSVRRGSFDTVCALITHIKRYIARWNDHQDPVRLDQRTRRDHQEGPPEGSLT